MSGFCRGAQGKLSEQAQASYTAAQVNQRREAARKRDEHFISRFVNSLASAEQAAVGVTRKNVESMMLALSTVMASTVGSGDMVWCASIYLKYFTMYRAVDNPVPPGAYVFTLWLSVLCMRSKAWLATRMSLRLALQAVISAHVVFAPCMGLFQSFLCMLRSH